MQKVIANKISFKNYRNLKEESLYPSSKINIIYGKNAQGKTNFLELIWLFTGGKSFRGTKDKDLISFCKDKSELNINFFARERDQEIKITIDNCSKIKRTAILNGVKKGSASSLIGNFCAVVFSPTHLSLIKDGPSSRRKFVDAAICQIKPAYTHTILKYNHVLNQRNILLKNSMQNKNWLNSIEVWDEHLAYLGSKIVCERISYCEKLKTIASKIYMDMFKNSENLNLQYQTNLKKDKTSLNEEILNIKLKKCLKLKLQSDITSGFTSVGPHRDDIIININNNLAKIFASQGQQRSAVLSIKLAEASILKDNLYEPPIILLDDVMSELDFPRQSYLISNIKDYQTFMTCCEMSGIKDLINNLNVKTFMIENGEFINK